MVKSTSDKGTHGRYRQLGPQEAAHKIFRENAHVKHKYDRSLQ